MFAVLHHHPTPLADPAAFEAAYQQHHRQVFRYSMALCNGCTSDAEDITAETFLRAWRGRARFTGTDADALAWLLTIARHTLIDRQRLTRIDRISDTLNDEIVDLGQPLEDLVLVNDDLQTVLAAIHTLPLPQREVVILRYMLDWKVTAIARHLTISENAASVTLHRAIKRLRSLLHTLQEESHD